MLNKNENNTLYILYSGKDEQIIKIKDKIKDYIKYDLKLELFDYQDRDRVNKLNEDERHSKMSTLSKAIADGEVIVLHLDKHYLNSIYCLDELNILGNKSDAFYTRKLICIVHDAEILNKIYNKNDANGIDSLMKNIDDAIKPYEKNKLEFDGYRKNIRNFFEALRDYRYKAIKCIDKDETALNEIFNNIKNITINLQDYIRNLEQERKEQKEAIEKTNILMPMIYSGVNIIILFSFFLLFAISGYLAYRYYETNKVSIEYISMDKRLDLNKSFLKKIVNNKNYAEYRGWSTLYNGSQFELRGLYYHNKSTIPIEFEDNIRKELNNFIFFLEKQKSQYISYLNNFYSYDNIKINTLYFDLLIQEYFSENTNLKQKKERIKKFLKKEIQHLENLINKLQVNLLIRKKQLFKVRILNHNNKDILIENKSSIKYQNKLITLQRVKKPLNSKELLSVPVYNGESKSESYEITEYKILEAERITTLWYETINDIIICDKGSNYEIMLRNIDNRVISKKEECP